MDVLILKEKGVSSITVTHNIGDFRLCPNVTWLASAMQLYRINFGEVFWNAFWLVFESESGHLFNDNARIENY